VQAIGRIAHALQHNPEQKLVLNLQLHSQHSLIGTSKAMSMLPIPLQHHKTVYELLGRKGVYIGEDDDELKLSKPVNIARFPHSGQLRKLVRQITLDGLEDKIVQESHRFNTTRARKSLVGL
jgi:hypothetical protein